MIDNPVLQEGGIHQSTTEMITVETPEDDAIPTSSPEEEDDEKWPSLYCCMIAAMASMNSCNIGYDIGVNTGLTESFQSGHPGQVYMTNVELEMCMGALNLTSIFGGATMFAISARYGRRGVFLVSQIVLLLGLVMSISSNNYYLIVGGKLISGFGVGFGFAVDPMYISEIAPKKFRGQLVSWCETGINIGILLGFCLSYACKGIQGNAQWKVMMSLGMVLPIIMIALVIFVIPESPRWLVMNGRKEEAVAILRRISSHSSDPNRGTVLVDELEADIKEELAASAGVTWSGLFADAINKRKLLCGVGVACTGSLTGINGIQYYLMIIFISVGITSTAERYQALILVGLAKLLTISVGGYGFDRVGRRPLLIASHLGMMAMLLVVACTSGGLVPESFGGGIGFAAVVVYVCFFSLGMGPGAWLIPSEVFSNDIRSKAMSVSTVCNRTLSLFVTVSFLSMKTALGPSGVYYVYAATTALSALFIYWVLPETKGLCLEQVHALFVPSQQEQEQGQGQKGDGEGKGANNPRVSNKLEFHM
jgi:sugar porter (SP) family MFS transporter